jgi:hypothetical protein
VLVIAAALLGHVSGMLLGQADTAPQAADCVTIRPGTAPAPPATAAGEGQVAGDGLSHGAAGPAGVTTAVPNGPVAAATSPAIRRQPASLIAAATATGPATVTGNATAGLAPVVTALIACAVLGVYAGPLITLLHSAAATITGTP